MTLILPERLTRKVTFRLGSGRNPLEEGDPPHAGQLKILRSKHHQRLVITGNRWGKTRLGISEVLWCAHGLHPWREVIWNPELFWICSPGFPLGRGLHKMMFEKLCPPAWLQRFVWSTNKYAMIEREGGGVCEVRFLSYKQALQDWVGAEVDGGWMDEEPPQDKFDELGARVASVGGWRLATFTPIEGLGWWYNGLYLPAKEGEIDWELHRGALATRDETVPLDEYEVGEPLVPQFTRAELITFAAKFPDEADRAVRIFGEVVSKKGLVYKGWSREYHLVPRRELPAHTELWGGLDPGYHGFAVVLTMVDEDNEITVVQEFFSTQQTIPDNLEALVCQIEELGVKGDVIIFCDTEAKDMVLNLNNAADDLHVRDPSRPVPVFVQLEQGLKARKAGVMLIQQLLQPDKTREARPDLGRETLAVGEPRLYVFDDLKSEWTDDRRGIRRTSRFVHEIEDYKWKKAKPGQAQPDDPDDAGTASGAHAMSAIRYMAMGRIGPPMLTVERERAVRKPALEKELSERMMGLPKHVRDHAASIIRREREKAGW